MPHRVHIGIGSNLGERLGYLQGAVDGLAALEPSFATAARREWKSDATRKRLDVRRVSFESSYQKRARQVLQTT